MNILWLAWKDHAHPARGGAERVLHELLTRQIADGHHVTLLTARYPGAKTQETVDGVDIIRVGTNRYLHPVLALVYYLTKLRGKFDVVIETVNTAPYFSLLSPGKAKAFALYHQLAREVWFYETKAPLSHFGYYVLEPFSTWLLARSRAALVTVSESTKQDLLRYGWKADNTHIISEGIHIKPLAHPDEFDKYDHPTVLSFGALRGMKRTLDQIEAFEIAKQQLPNLELKIAGDASDAYGRQVLHRITNSRYANSIEYLGRVSDSIKTELMRRCHLIAVTSIKEGWGLIVSEANAQGTPAVVYDVDGLRDSVRSGHTGLVTDPTPVALASGIVELLGDTALYKKLQHSAWEWSKQLTFNHSYQDLKRIVEATI